MDKRSWPWRKKSSERVLSLSETSESSSFPSARHLDYQDVTTISPDHSQMIDDGTTHCQENEEKIKVLNDKLSAALLDAASKEVLAKQHAKLAEEAVSGWETVEAEAAALKQQLESTIQQKLATEDRVSHLDGALKECMRQLRNVREEQEEKIHNAIMRKTRDWDTKRFELEEKFSDLEQNFFEKDAENRAMSRSLQERSQCISEINDACSKAQTEATMLHIRLESLEKEKTTLKYDLNVAHKELDIRNEEKGLTKRATDAASKQHMEDIRRINKLEAECQRLRGLIRKKLPGPAAIAQMKLEVEGPGNEKNDVRKKNCTGVISSRDSSLQEITREENQQSKEEDLWPDRYSLLEEETKKLREILAKRNNELQSARLMCARTASKLSSVEQQLETSNINHGIQKMPVLSGLEMLSNSAEPSLASRSEDGNDGEVSCAESWASALIAELDQFKKGKSMPIIKTTSASNTDSDDYMGMEQLASLRPCDKLNPKQHTFKDDKDGAALEQAVSMTGMLTETNAFSEESLIKDVELHGAGELFKEVTAKLAAREEELARNAADQATLMNLKKKLIFLFEESADVGEVLEQIRADIGLRGPLPANMKGLLSHGLSRNLQLREDMQFRISDLDTKCQKLVAVTSNFLSRKVELVQLMEELSSTLSHISRIQSSENNICGPAMQKCSSRGSSIHASGEMDFSGVGSPMSDSSKSESSDAAAKIVPADENTETCCRKDNFSPEVLRLEEELRKAVSEKVALETQMKTVNRRFSEIQQELLQLKVVTKDMEATMEKDQAELERLRAQVYEAEHMLINFQNQLSAAQSSKLLAETRLIKMAASREESDSQLHSCNTELSILLDRVKGIAKELSHEQKKNSDLESKCKDLQDQLEVGSSLRCPRCCIAAGEDEQISREFEIAAATEKLAECERTILVLGHQLKALVSPKGSPQKAVQSFLSFDQAQPDSLRNHTATGYDNAWEGCNSARVSDESRDFVGQSAWEGANSARCSEPRDLASNKRSEGIKEESPWDPRQSIASDILDSELMSLSLQGHTPGRKLFDIFGDKIPVHEDYIEAVAQMPSSPEADPVSPKRFTSKPPCRKKKIPRSFAGVDMSKSMNDACSLSAEKHVNTFSRFFARTKSTN